MTPVRGKVAEEGREDIERRMQSYFKGLSESQQVDTIGRFVPQFGECLRDLQNTRLKYMAVLGN